MNPTHAHSPVYPVHETTVRVTYRMTDQMGVVYYGNYLELFEIGRTELLRASGLAYRQMEQDGYFLPVVRVECDYLAPAKYDDLLVIRTRIERLSRVRIDFGYEILRSGDPAQPPAILCRALTRHVIIGSEGHPRRLDKTWMSRLSSLAHKGEG